MTTKVFISWSGSLSKELAEALRQWLPGVLQFVKPYYTPSDIEKGTQWTGSILKELEKSDIGIICLTKDNLKQPWILFESGALSKNFEKSKVCTVLFNVDNTDLTGPLTIFQSTKFEKSEFKKLIKTINNTASENKLEETVLDEVFNMWWPKLEEKIDGILGSQQSPEEITQRTDRDLIEEILELTRLRVNSDIRKSRFRISDKAFSHLISLLSKLAKAHLSGDAERFKMIYAELELPLGVILKRSENETLLRKFSNSARLLLSESDESESE